MTTNSIFEMKCFDSLGDSQIESAASQLIVYNLALRKKKAMFPNGAPAMFLIFPQQELIVKVMDVDFVGFEEKCKQILEQ